jgi:hypothetical protein
LNLRRAKSFLDRQLECAPRKILKTIALWGSFLWFNGYFYSSARFHNISNMESP